MVRQCEICNGIIPSRIEIDGSMKLLSNHRKFCLQCSPYGNHNTSKRPVDKLYQCKFCGEEDPVKMAHKGKGRKAYNLCKECFNKDNIERGRKKKQYLVEFKGGKCESCGYSKVFSALEFHHLEAKHKDPQFKNMRYWDLEKAKKELEKCLLLCSNCHREAHEKLLGKI